VSDLDYAGAAADLNLPEAWLRNNIGRLPHRKYGRHVRFTDEDRAAIRAMHKTAPSASAGLALDPPALQPSRARRRSVRSAAAPAAAASP